METDEDIVRHLRLIRLVRASLLVAVGVYATVLVSLPPGLIVTMPAATLNLITVALAVISVIEIPAALLAPRWLVGLYKKKDQAVSFFNVQILQGSLLGAIAIYGLILGMLGTGMQIAAPFFVVSAGLQILTFPTLERYKRFVSPG